MNVLSLSLKLQSFAFSCLYQSYIFIIATKVVRRGRQKEREREREREREKQSFAYASRKKT